MAKEKPFVSIIIPVFNSGKTLREAIEACKNQDYPKDKLEVIVVDDGSTEDIKTLVENLGVKYIYQENSGPASARNNGWMSSKGEALFFTDADCSPLKDCISVMTKSLYDKNAAVVAGTYEIQNGKDIMARCIHSEIMFRHSRMPEYINSFGAYNILIKRSVMEELGGFNEYYLTSSAEDSELAYRVIKKGYRIYFDRRSIVAHFHENSLYRYLKKQAIRSFWAIKLWKHHSGLALNDYYLHWKDLLEIPVAVMIIVSLPLLFLDTIRMGFILLLIIYIALQIIIPLKIYSKKRYKKDFFFMFFMMFARGFVRVFGGALSFIRPSATKATAGKK